MRQALPHVAGLEMRIDGGLAGRLFEQDNTSGLL
jgi:hypothetical protein